MDLDRRAAALYAQGHYIAPMEGGTMKRVVGPLFLALVIAAVFPAAAVHGSPAVKKVCKTVTKRVHHKKRRVTVCHTFKPKPHAVVSTSLSPQPSGFTFAKISDGYEFTDLTYGDRLDLTRIGIAKDKTDPTQYVFSMYVGASKIPSPMDGTQPNWAFTPDMFGLIATNGHPYPFLSIICPSRPLIVSEDLYNGESADGWVCTEIPAQYLAGSYSLIWAGGPPFAEEPTAILNVSFEMKAN